MARCWRRWRLNDEQYIALMKRLRPDVKISTELIALFKAQYPAGSAALMQLQMMLAVAPLVKRVKQGSHKR